MLGDPLPYPRGHRTTIQQLPLDYHPAESGTVMLLVKALNGAVVYQDYDTPVPIPEDQFVPVALTPTIAQAIHDGDLEKQGRAFLDMDEEERKRAATPTSRARHARTTTAETPAAPPSRRPSPPAE